MALYLITTGIFMSVLCYGGLVALMESTGRAPKAMGPAALPMVLLVVAVLMWVPMSALERFVLAGGTPVAAR